MEKRDEQKTIPTADAEKTADVLFEEMVSAFCEFCNCSDLLVQKLKETEKKQQKMMTEKDIKPCPFCGGEKHGRDEKNV